MKAIAVGEGIGLALKRRPAGATAGRQGAALWFCLICRAKACAAREAFLPT